MLSMVGTPITMSPEVLERKAYTSKADVWSLGCIFFELLTGQPPFLAINKDRIKKKIYIGDYFLPRWRSICSSARDCDLCWRHHGVVCLCHHDAEPGFLGTLAEHPAGTGMA